MTPRPPKKSETLEIRLSHATKRAFMARCRDRGATASDAVRGFIEAEVAHRPSRSRLWQALAAAVAGLAVGAVAAPSLAQSSLAQSRPADRAAFDRLDHDRDGVLSFAEFRR